MRKIFYFIMALFTASPALAGNLCGSGIICLEQNTQITATNAAVAPVTLTLFTCHSTLNGCLVQAIMVYGHATHSTSQNLIYDMVQGGTSSIMFIAAPQPLTSLNVMVSNVFPPPPLPSSPVDANSNPVIFMTPGSSITVTTTVNWPTGGDVSSSTIDFMVYAQQY